MSADFQEYGYPFTQLFEPGVLHELALLEGIPYDDLEQLAYQPTRALQRLSDLTEQPGALSAVELVNVASALVSVSRFELAARIVERARTIAYDERTRFEIAWVAFLISNRLRDGAESPAAFRVMRSAVEAGAVPPQRALDPCTQALVWYLKRKEVPRADYKWSMQTGQRIVDTLETRDAGTVSSWYRAVAMEPAARGDGRATRDYMNRARDAAEQVLADCPGALEKNLLKTYYESSVKEQMFLHRDLGAAVVAGEKLIALDPAWAPSYGELAEAYELFGVMHQAAKCYERAAVAGPPYLGHHLTCAARCRLALDEPDRALAHYCALLTIAPQSAAARAGGDALLDRVAGPTRERYESVRAAAGGDRRAGRC